MSVYLSDLARVRVATRRAHSCGQILRGGGGYCGQSYANQVMESCRYQQNIDFLPK